MGVTEHVGERVTVINTRTVLIVERLRRGRTTEVDKNAE